MLLDTVMSHIVKNDMYLIDFDGKPTMWGKWNPKYVNSFPTNVGDRKLNSSNIVSMLQTAYHFTKKEKYKAKAFELMNKYGYYENMMRPMSDIGKAAPTMLMNMPNTCRTAGTIRMMKCILSAIGDCIVIRLMIL